MDECSSSQTLQSNRPSISHAFHVNLPSPHHFNADDGIPYATRYAEWKSTQIVNIVQTMTLNSEMFVAGAAGTTLDDADADVGPDDEEINIDGDTNENKLTLLTLSGKCRQLQGLMHGLDGLKWLGLTRLELSDIVLHLLKLLTATITLSSDRTDVTIHYESVGYKRFIKDMVTASNSDSKGKYDQQQQLLAPSLESLENELHNQTFALPAYIRESLLSSLIDLLSNKGPLRSVSNNALFPTNINACQNDSNDPRFLLIVHWKCMLRLLLRTSPQLNEHLPAELPNSSASYVTLIVKRTVELIRHVRHFFDQSISLQKDGDKMKTIVSDTTALQVWEMTKPSLMKETHTMSCYRALTIIYLFTPTRCSSQFYNTMIPIYLDCWSTIDRFPDLDFLYLNLICRARKHASPGPWKTALCKQLLTQCQYWLTLPSGGSKGGMDSSSAHLFPAAGKPRNRHAVSRLKVFLGSIGSGYENGIAFLSKICKLLVFCSGLNDGNHDNEDISESTKDILQFLAFVTPYFHPSNVGSWTYALGAFLNYFSYELCGYVGLKGCLPMLKMSHPELYASLLESEPMLQNSNSSSIISSKGLVAILNALLPLSQQALYSKNQGVSQAGESSLLSLAQISPQYITPILLDFCLCALDVSAIHTAHQAPAAISVISRLIQPGLRYCTKEFLNRLGFLLRLSLMGIDGNDFNKTIRTLILYRSLTGWLIVGNNHTTDKNTENGERDCSSSMNGSTKVGKNMVHHLSQITTSATYRKAMDELPSSSFFKQSSTQPETTDGNDNDNNELNLLIEEASSSLTDWMLEFLDRVYGLLRSTGEREKKARSGSSSNNGNVRETRNFSRVFKETMMQCFASMGYVHTNGQQGGGVQENIHALAVKSVARFLEEETLPFAVKESSLLCQAVAAARFENSSHTTTNSPGFDVLIPILTQNLSHDSNKTVIYRLRCLSGAVKSCSLHTLLQHKDTLKKTISFALASDDKHVMKTGCKLFRHTLGVLSECQVLACDAMPRPHTLGKSSELDNDPVVWQIPNTESLVFAHELLECHVLRRITKVGEENKSSNGMVLNIQEVRRCLRVIRYALRGASGIILDNYASSSNSCGEDIKNPHEQAARKLLVATLDDKTKCALMQLRGRLQSFVTLLVSFIASETFPQAYSTTSGNGTETTSAEVITSNDNNNNHWTLLSSDTKICKELSILSKLLLTHRGNTTSTKTHSELHEIWKGQQHLLTDFALYTAAEFVSKTLQRGQLYGGNSSGKNDDNYCASISEWKDGEDSGKTLPRRLICSRVQLFHNSLSLTSRFEIPKRLLAEQKQLQQKDIDGSNMMNDVDMVIDSSDILFSARIGRDKRASSLTQLIQSIAKVSNNVATMNQYEALMDGLFSLCCHSNTKVRQYGISAVSSSLPKYKFLLKNRLSRLLSALRLEENTDDDDNRTYGIPSTFAAKTMIDNQKKRKRLSEILKGICALLSVPRIGIMRRLLAKEEIRYEFVQTILDNDLVSLMPPEEMQALVHYLHDIFKSFKSGFYELKRVVGGSEEGLHGDCLNFLMNILEEGSGLRTTTASNKLSSVVENGTTVLENGASVVEDGTATSKIEQMAIEDTATMTVGKESSTTTGTATNQIKTATHWRKRLMTGFFLTSMTDAIDMANTANNSNIPTRIWNMTFHLLEQEQGQPLQRVILGLFARLVHLTNTSSSLSSSLRSRLSSQQMSTEAFCETFCNALVYDHKEDTSVGGGHDAQWSIGVADMLHGALRNVTQPVDLFPFMRHNQSSVVFKIGHAKLVEVFLLSFVDASKEGSEGDNESALNTASKHLLSVATKMAGAPPSEDQRNQHGTSSEIFAGVCRAQLLFQQHRDIESVWNTLLLPFLEDAIPKIPISMIGAYFDAIRYAIHYFHPNTYYLFTAWILDKIEASLWQPTAVVDTPKSFNNINDSTAASSNQQQGTDSFAAQSKWLYYCCAPLVEIDDFEDVIAMKPTDADEQQKQAVLQLDRNTVSTTKLPWYSSSLIQSEDTFFSNDKDDCAMQDNKQSREQKLSSTSSTWKLILDKLLPRLLSAIGHPYESCRDHIAHCLFRICHGHRKRIIMSGEQDEIGEDPGNIIVNKFSALLIKNSAAAIAATTSFRNKYHSLMTVRRFFTYCIHYGEARVEFSNYIIPLIPMTFEVIRLTVGDDDDETVESEKKGTKNDAGDVSTATGTNGNNGTATTTNNSILVLSEADTIAKRSLEAEVVKSYRYAISEISVSCILSYSMGIESDNNNKETSQDVSIKKKTNDDISRILTIIEQTAKHETWQVRHAATNFLRCFHGSHKFLLTSTHSETITSIVTTLLADDQREVSSAAMAAVTGIISVMGAEDGLVLGLVQKYIKLANSSLKKKKRKKKKTDTTTTITIATTTPLSKTTACIDKTQQLSIFFLCASIMAQPYHTPPYVPLALAAISKHSFERNAPLNVRDIVKKCCAEYKKSHMSDNWELHRKAFTQEQMEALGDVVSSPHYYA